MARLGGLEDILWGYVKKQNLWGGDVKKTEILRGYQNISRHEKNYFLSMLPLVGGSPYSRGLLLLAGSRGYGETEQSIGERRGFPICKTSPICRQVWLLFTKFFTILQYLICANWRYHVSEHSAISLRGSDRIPIPSGL